MAYGLQYTNMKNTCRLQFTKKRVPIPPKTSTLLFFNNSVKN